MTLTDTLNRLLAASGLPAAEVARRAGLGKSGPQQLHSILNGQNTNPTYERLKSIVEAMGGKLIILSPSGPVPWDGRAADGRAAGKRMGRRPAVRTSEE
jgi:transcriptional regulator with XRE-family HTH domain